MTRKSTDPVANVKQTSAAQKLEAFGMDKICERTADITPQRTIAKEIGVSWATMTSWIDADAGRIEQYARAREAQADKLAEEIIQIADDGLNDSYRDDEGNKRTDQDVIARSRLRVDARRWLAGKMAPKRYGDRLALDADVKVTRKLSDMTDDELLLIASRKTPNAD